LSAETWAFAAATFLAGIGVGAAGGVIWSLWFPPSQLRQATPASRMEGKP